MPLIESREEQSLFDRLITDEQGGDDAPFVEKLKAALTVDNSLGAYLVREDNLPYSRVLSPTYNPWDEMSEAERLDTEFVEHALTADNPGELNAVRRQIAKEREARAKLKGVDGVLAAMAAGVADPINLVPVGGVAYRTYRTGGSVLKSGLVTMTAAGASASAQEAALHSQQLERTFGESAVNVTAAGLLGLAFGAGLGKLSKTRYRTLVRDTEKAMDLDEPVYAPAAVDVGESGQVRIKGGVAEQLTKALGFDPLSRILTGRSQQARRILAELVENPIDVEGFTGQAVESLAKVRRDSLLYRGLRAHTDILKDYRKSGGTLNRRAFNELVARELRNPGTVENPHVSRSAKAWKREVYDPQFQAIVEVKLLPEDVEVTTAEQYVNRVWNKEKVGANLPRFKEITTKWLMGRDTELSAADAQEIASEIAGHIMTRPNGILDLNYRVGARLVQEGKLKSPFQPRVFDIEDALVEEFLENDIEKLAGRYLRQTSTDVEIVRRFGPSESDPEDVINLKEQKRQISDEYSQLMSQAKTEKQRLALQKEMNRALSDLQAVVERMRGVYSIPDSNNLIHRMLHAARNLNFLRLLGGVTISSFPDAARIVMAEGFSRSFGTAMRPLIRGVKAAKPAAEDVRYWGIGTDSITGGRLEVISDITDYALGGTRFERGLQSMAQSFGRVNLMDQWTGFMKTTHAISMQTRLMDMLEKGVYDTRLGRLGIEESDAFRIAEQVRRYGRREGNAWIYNAKDWDRQDLALQWAAALKKESDRVIVVPGQERPLFMSREVGKTVMQFRSFMMAATQRVLIAGIQGQDAHLLQGLAGMIAFGASVYVYKQWEAGREISDDPRQWIIEGIDRSGALGILMEANNTVEKMSSSHFGLRPMFGVGAEPSRYASRSQAEAFLGPTYGSLLSTTMRVLNAASSEYEWTDADTRAVRRLLPYQNLSVIRMGFDRIEEQLSE